ncbi:MAG TPA: ATP-binding protein [Micromonosporaceae bacterium]|nr:ATP-binding protein [Micromonosporaceae bacterium]
MTWTGSWSLGRRITALCGAVALLLGVIAISAAISAVHNRSDVRALLERVGPARNNSERLMSMVLTQQAGIRAYALSAAGDDLARYHEAVREEEALVASIRGALAGDPLLDARLDTATSATDAWRRDVAEPAVAAVRAHGPDPAHATIDPQEKAKFQRATDAVTALQQAVSDRRETLAYSISSSGDRVIAFLLSAAAVVLLAGLALALLLRRLVTRPVVELAEGVRLVAGGDYAREIHTKGPPEVVGLARDVDLMRQRIADDLAEVRAARRQVEEANRLLEEQATELTRSNRDLEQFAYVASHDLQEPLRKVASFCQLLQRRYSGQLDERADQYIAFAVDGAQRMQRLINDLLAFSRIGRLTTGFHDVDLTKVVTDAANQLDARRDEAGAEITWDPLPTVRGEEPLLLALFANLISNSLKFRKPDVPSRIHLSARQVGPDWEISCRDNGIGISPEFADKVFVIFQRLHAKETYPGTGIGLAIAKKIIEYHGGHIWLDTDHQDGTLIYFTLPVPAEPAAVQDEPSTPSLASPAVPPAELVPAAARPTEESPS